MRNVYLFICFLFSAFLAPWNSLAQNLPVGTPVIEDLYRREQLLGRLDSNVSFTIRPLSPRAAFGVDHVFNPLDSAAEKRAVSSKIRYLKDPNVEFQVLPITLTQQYNTHHPYGWNDGAMIPARGYQSLLSAGVYARWKFLSVQFQPEFVYAENRDFDGFTQAEHDDKAWGEWYTLYNSTDLPERFGSEPYSKFLPGQSSIRVTFDPVSFGLSTGNLWWGPGTRSAIVMSNTATGFTHLTLNTTRPIHTLIGSFESQIIAGKLIGSGFSPVVPGQQGNRDNWYRAKRDDWRYLSGVVLSYHPKWVPGFFAGLTRTFQSYNNDLGNSFSDYFPFLGSYQKQRIDGSSGNSEEDAKFRDQLTSVYARWLWEEANGEVYFEYSKNDHSWNFRDFFLDPSHSRAYTLGLRKLFKTGHLDNEYIQVGFEVTQIAQAASFVNRDAWSFYEHSQVRHGHTNRGEVLGAGIGPGGSMQSLEVSWINGIKKIGLQIERYEHNVDFYYRAFDVGELRRRWVDFGIGLNSDWKVGKSIFSGKILYTRSFNYEWKFKENRDVFYWDQKHYDTNNVHVSISVMLR